MQPSIVIDVDDTILITENRDYKNSKPIQEIIDVINNLYNKGWKVILYTARGQLSNNFNIEKIEKEVRPILEDWLIRNKVKYSELVMGKPYSSTVYVDDKAIRPDEFLKTYGQQNNTN